VSPVARLFAAGDDQQAVAEGQAKVRTDHRALGHAYGIEYAIEDAVEAQHVARVSGPAMDKTREIHDRQKQALVRDRGLDAKPGGPQLRLESARRVPPGR